MQQTSSNGLRSKNKSYIVLRSMFPLIEFPSTDWNVSGFIGHRRQSEQQGQPKSASKNPTPFVYTLKHDIGTPVMYFSAKKTTYQAAIKG